MRQIVDWWKGKVVVNAITSIPTEAMAQRFSDCPLVPNLLKIEFGKRNSRATFQRLQQHYVTPAFATLNQHHVSKLETKQSSIQRAGKGLFVRNGCHLAAGACLPLLLLTASNDSVKLDDVGFSANRTHIVIDLNREVYKAQQYTQSSRRGSNVHGRYFVVNNDSISCSATSINVQSGQELFRSYGAAYWVYQNLLRVLLTNRGTKLSDHVMGLQFETDEQDIHARHTYILICWVLIYHHLMYFADDNEWNEMYALLCWELSLDHEWFPNFSKLDCTPEAAAERKRSVEAQRDTLCKST